MKGAWLKALCASGTDCGWLVVAAPLFFAFLMFICGYDFRKTYIRKIKEKKIYDEKTNPNGYLVLDLLKLIFDAVGFLAFGAFAIYFMILFIN